jgi:hypothetical protein
MLCKIWGFHGGDYEESESESESLCDWRSVSQYVLVSSPVRDSWPDVDYEECRLLRHKTPVRTSQKTHYVSATEPSRLMLCKIWGFHGGDYKECLLRYETPGHTSQETQYVSSTEPRRLMLWKIWGSHGGDYEECLLLRYETPGRT